MIPLRWQPPLRLAWLVLVTLTIALFVVALPDQLREWDETAPLELAKIVFFYSIWLVVGGLLFVRKSGEWMALLTAYFLVTFPTQWDMIVENWMSAHPGLALPVQVLRALTSLGLIGFLALFPNGRFAPRWTRWLALVWVAYNLWTFLPSEWRPVGEYWNAINVIVGVAALACLMTAQIIRYKRYSAPIERQQTRWVIFGFSLGIGIVFLMVVVALFTSAMDAAVQAQTPFAIKLLYQTAVVMMPLSIGVAILRS